MGGVDLFDQLIQYYPFARRTKRWTHKLTKYLLQVAVQNAYILYCCFSTDAKKMSHLEFMEMAGDALVNFDLAAWPTTSDPIPRAPDLPVDQRADLMPGPAAPPRPASSDEDIDDPQPLPDAPAAAAPAPVPEAPAPDEDMPAPHGAAPRRRNIDPACCMQPGNHELVRIGGRKQRRCRVCHASGKAF